MFYKPIVYLHIWFTNNTLDTSEQKIETGRLYIIVYPAVISPVELDVFSDLDLKHMIGKLLYCDNVLSLDR